VQRAHLGRTRFPEYSAQQMFEAGMFLQQDMAVAPTGKEYAREWGIRKILTHTPTE
jgi:hypothetical protein